MSIGFSCAQCGAKLSVSDALAGKRVRCPKCQAVAAVPAASADEVAVAPLEVPEPAAPTGGELPVAAPPEKKAPARKGPSRATIKAGLIGGACVGMGVATTFSLVDYFLFGRRVGMPGLVPTMVSSVVVGALLGAIIGLVIAFTRSLVACVGVSAAVLAGLKLGAFHLLGGRGGASTTLVAVSGAIGGAIMGYLIARTTASSVSWEE